MSTAYSGIGTVEQASHQACTSINSLEGSAHHATIPLWALEKDSACKAELAHWFANHGHHAACVFGNLKLLVDPSWHADLGFAPHSTELPPAQLYANGLHNCTLTIDRQPCAVHGRAGCTLRHSDIHVAGTTCVDHSNYGSCKGDEGKNVKLFLIWCALMKQLLPFVILHENVAGFGTTALTETLGALHIICSSVSCSSVMGYPIRRKRQMCILILKKWIYPQLRAANMHSCCNPVDVRRLVGLQDTLDTLSKRPCHLTWHDFIVAPADAITEEVNEAKRRPGVVDRWAAVAAGETTLSDKNGHPQRLFPDDTDSPVLAALLPAERERIEFVVRSTSPGIDVIDVSQNPDKRARVIKTGARTFMTVIAGSGYLVRLDCMRADRRSTTFVTASDILSMSGFPVTPDQVAAAGCPCMFSTSSTQPPERTSRSMKKQVGNAMHFTHVGAVFLCAVLKLQSLGSTTDSTGTSVPRSILPMKRSASPQPAEASSAASSSARALRPSSDFRRAVRARRNHEYHD